MKSLRQRFFFIEANYRASGGPYEIKSRVTEFVCVTLELNEAEKQAEEKALNVLLTHLKDVHQRQLGEEMFVRFDDCKVTQTHRPLFGEGFRCDKEGCIKSAL